MSKVTIFNHAYLTVELDDPMPWPRKDSDEELRKKAWLDLGRDVAEQIKRHCDGVYKYGVHVEADIHNLCEHCGLVWTEDGSAYNGGCCSEDEEAAPAAGTSVLATLRWKSKSWMRPM